MTRFYFHASHEQFPPSALVRFAREAESAGFDGVFSSDHLQPWLPSQGEAGFIWSWLGAAMASTERICFAGITIPGGERFHPVVVAQAIATLAEMFPARLPWIAFGSGEALNEVPLGVPWAEKAERRERLKSAVDIVRRLLAAETVTRSGPIEAVAARIWSLPTETPRLFGAAISAETAAWLAPWADGLLTVGVNADQVAKIISAFRTAGGAAKPVHLKVDVCLGSSDAEALAEAHREWRISALPTAALADLASPAEMERAAQAVSPEAVAQKVIVSGSPATIAARLRALVALGIDALDVHHVGRNQTRFIDVFGSKILPELR